VAVALTFSSTIIIVKLLSDKRELDSLHGRIAVGFLIVQDLAVVIAMMAMSTMRGSAGDAGGWLSLLGSLGWRLAAAGALMFVLMRWVLPALTAAMARSQELLLVFAVAWGLGLAALGEWAGFSKEAGAFLAGFSLASTPYREAMNARLTSLRDFLLLFFFIDLGAKLDLSTLGAEIGSAIALSLFVPMGYRRRTGFLAGLTVAQISEFSIVFIAMGITLGHIGVSALGLVTLVGLITITASTYLILYSHWLYERLAPWLRMFERRKAWREDGDEPHDGTDGPPEVVVVGQGRYGSRLLLQLRAAGIRAVGIDFDPEAVRTLRGRGLPVHFGDGEDPEFLQSLPLAGARWVITTLPQWESNRALLHALQLAGYAGAIAGAARDPAHARELRASGIHTLLNPFEDAADHAAERLVRLIQPRETAA
jgi:hypothetical protein